MKKQLLLASALCALGAAVLAGCSKETVCAADETNVGLPPVRS